MHAASDRGPQIQLGKRAAVALAIAAASVLASCGSSSHDTPGLSGPQSGTTPSTFRSEATGPAVSIIRVSGLPVPQLAGKPAINAALSAIGSRLSGTCTVTAERDDTRVASFLWTCGGRPTAATFDLRTGQQLTLDSILQGGYRSYLSSTAAAQMQANGASDPTATDFSVWYLTPQYLVVVFPSGTVNFPVSSLGPYLRTGGALG